jgi:hypothetical protein
MPRPIVVLLVATGFVAPFAPVQAKPRKPLHRFVAADSLSWPAGTERIRFENVEGIVLIRGTLRGRMEGDTTGPLALDTGAGYLALDVDLARLIGLADTTADLDAVDVASHPLPRLTLGAWTLSDVQPVLTVDGEIVRRVSDRPVLGLLGQKPFGDRALWIDYREQILAVVPTTRSQDVAAHPPVRDGSESAGGDSVGDSRALLSGLLTRGAVPVPFSLVGDGKILVRGTVADPTPARPSRPLNLIVDTGATKCVLFEDALAPSVVHAARWPALRGLSAPTLIGTAEARIARVPVIELAAAGGGRCTAHDVDVGVIRSELSQVLSRVARETIHGLVGYSFLKRFRVAVDYRHHVLWLDPIPGYRDDRPLEYCHVGLQLERRGPGVVVVGVVDGSPAARAGIARGDEVVALDGVAAASEDLITLTRRMEGQPGRALTIVIRRDSVERSIRLIRRRLL